MLNSNTEAKDDNAYHFKKMFPGEWMTPHPEQKNATGSGREMMDIAEIVLH
jgi:hypothetical protein